MELLKLLSTSQIVAHIVSFLVLLAILRFFLWKRFLAILDDRRDRIAHELKKIEDAKSDVEKIKADYEEKIALIKDEASQKIKEAMEEARRIAQAIREKAEADSEHMFENAKENIKVEIAKAREELKDKIVELSIDIAGKVIEEKLSEETDKKLVEEFLKGLEKK